MDTEKTFKRI